LLHGNNQTPNNHHTCPKQATHKAYATLRQKITVACNGASCRVDTFMEREKGTPSLSASQQRGRCRPWQRGAKRCAPRATGVLHWWALPQPGRSRSASLAPSVKGRFSRHRLLRAAGMSTVPATPTSLKLSEML